MSIPDPTYVDPEVPVRLRCARCDEAVAGQRSGSTDFRYVAKELKRHDDVVHPPYTSDIIGPLQEAVDAINGGDLGPVPVGSRFWLERVDTPILPRTPIPPRVDEPPERVGAVHLLLRWNAETEPRTIEKHKAIADAAGAAWWGKFGRPEARPMSAERLAAFKRQIASGVETHVYLYRPGSTWRATLRDITFEPEAIDRARLPDYYAAEDCHLFLELSEFHELDPAWPLADLTLQSNPGSHLANAFKGKTPLFYVLEQDPDEGPEPPIERRLSFEWLVERTLWQPDALHEVLDTLQEERQVILAGPPGTGKTWVADALARFLTANDRSRQRLVQFHPSYTYEEFVVGLRPVPAGNALTFAPTMGALARIANVARGSAIDHVLVIDEMNRANLPRVFGELLYLLEYRDQPLDLLYLDGFTLPSEVMIIGTMNTADRSIRSIDVALRRRFEIFDCPPHPEALRRYYKTNVCEVDGLVEGFEALNQRLTEQLDRHHTVGHSFFMAEMFTPERLRKVWQRQLQPLLEEYFFDQPDIAAEFSISEFWPDAITTS